MRARVCVYMCVYVCVRVRVCVCVCVYVLYKNGYNFTLEKVLSS